MNHLTTTKHLSEFSGDAFERLHFKEAYKLSKETGGYSEPEHIAHLFTALKGDAREIVSIQLATSRDPDAVMKTLELHYGNKEAVADKIIYDLRKLPSIKSGEISLIQLATKITNATIAFKSFNLTGHLHSPELIVEIGATLPTGLYYV